MATGFGVGPDANGNGTSPEDIQKITAAEYASDGIISGAKVTGTSTMSYNVSDGAVVLDTATGMAVKIPVVATTVPTIPAPATGTREDTIYVKQNFPGTDEASNVVIGISHDGNIPANSIVLNRFVVGAGITATSAATSNWNRKFAVPMGGTLGRLYMSIDTSGVHASGVKFPRGAGSIYVPTDRDTEFIFTSTMSLSTSGGATPDVDWRASVTIGFFVDGVMVRAFEREISRMWSSQTVTFIHALTEGSHTVRYEIIDDWFPSTSSTSHRFWAVRHGGSNKLSGNDFRVYDRGVINW